MAPPIPASKHFPIHHACNELLGRFFARSSITPSRVHPGLDLARCEIVLERKHPTDDLSKITKERVSKRRHAPMQPDPLMAGYLGQQRNGPISQGKMLRLDTIPDAEEDASSLRPCLFARKFIAEALIYERTQFLLISRLDESVEKVIEPSTFQSVRDAYGVPHCVSLVIATNGTMTSSKAMPP
jgi:hypothetical protein